MCQFSSLTCQFIHNPNFFIPPSISQISLRPLSLKGFVFLLLVRFAAISSFLPTEAEVRDYLCVSPYPYHRHYYTTDDDSDMDSDDGGRGAGGASSSSAGTVQYRCYYYDNLDSSDYNNLRCGWRREFRSIDD
ncbi:hypothetical protein CASFOL_025065 [Castilleja foliolosa]|uniref:Uncharacterized protein n=1 Tax=Castilleja foliolosa TaxID=1961234 RepID=A0ABD3CTA5_9LAMI